MSLNTHVEIAGISIGGTNGKTLKVWGAQTGQETLTLTGHLYFVMSVSFSPDGKRIVSGSQDRTVKVWDARRRFSTPRR